jgi:Zn-dependent peptidase ImmA (M78 family)/DNA-binding XRE family transcriptional regulator
MVKSIKAKIKPEILIWARENAAYTIDIAAKKNAVSVEKLLSWENGKDAPTINQLRKIAQVYKFPLSVFYLSKPPKNFSVMHDFRRLSIDNILNYSPELKYEIRLAEQRRELALELFNELNENPSSFTFHVNLDDSPEELSLKIRKILNMKIDEQINWKDPRLAFNELRSKIEDLGILVFQAIKVDLKEMRGFSIAEQILPVIAINRKDSYNGRIFSLLHEFTHLMLGKGGVSDFSEEGERDIEDKRIEIFCNHVAAATLVPKEFILKESIVINNNNLSWDNLTLEELSKRYSVSKEVILRRLLTLGKTNESFYNKKRQEFIKELVETNKNKKIKDFKRNIPNETFSSLGTPYIKLVIDNYYKEKITLNQLSYFLGGIKIKHLKKIEEKLGWGV